MSSSFFGPHHKHKGAPRTEAVQYSDIHHQTPSIIPLNASSTAICSVTFARQHNAIVCASGKESSIRVYDLNTDGSPSAVFADHNSAVLALAMLGDDLVVSVSLQVITSRVSDENKISEWVHSTPLTAVAKLGDSNIVVGDVLGRLTVLNHWDGTLLKPCWNLTKKHSSCINCIIVSSTVFVTCAEDKTAVVWDTASFEPLATLKHDDDIRTAAINEKYIITATDKNLHVFDNTPSFKKSQLLHFPHNARHMQFLDDNNVALACEDGFFVVISVSKKSFISRCEISNTRLDSFVLLPNARIVVGGRDGGSCIFSPPQAILSLVQAHAARLYLLSNRYPLRAAWVDVQAGLLPLQTACTILITPKNCTRSLDEWCIAHNLLMRAVNSGYVPSSRDFNGYHLHWHKVLYCHCAKLATGEKDIAYLLFSFRQAEDAGVIGQGSSSSLKVTLSGRDDIIGNSRLVTHAIYKLFLYQAQTDVRLHRALLFTQSDQLPFLVNAILTCIPVVGTVTSNVLRGDVSSPNDHEVHNIVESLLGVSGDSNTFEYGSLVDRFVRRSSQVLSSEEWQCYSKEQRKAVEDAVCNLGLTVDQLKEKLDNISKNNEVVVRSSRLNTSVGKSKLHHKATPNRVSRHTTRLNARKLHRPTSTRKHRAMADECGLILDFDGWDVVSWPPVTVSDDVLEILSLSRSCQDGTKRRDIACEISGANVEDNCVDSFVAKQLGFPGPSRFYHIYGTDDPKTVLSIFLRQNLRKLGAQERFNILGTVESKVDEFRKSKELFPFWSFAQCLSYLRWSDSVVHLYSSIWEAELSNLKKFASRIQARRSASTASDDSKVVDAAYIIDILDVLVTTELNTPFLYSLVSTDEANFDWKGWIGLPTCPKVLRAPIFVCLQFAFSFLTRIFMHEYVSFLGGRLLKTSAVDKESSNVEFRLKGLHSRNRIEGSQEAWRDFEASLIKRELHNCPEIPRNINNGQSLHLMAEVLSAGTEHHRNIQTSLLARCLARGRVDICLSTNQLIKWRDGDRALVVPNLRKIFLHLNSKKWVDAYSIVPYQPLAGHSNDGIVRRIANILLAIEFKADGSNDINWNVLHALRDFAERGELYTDKLRSIALSKTWIEDRIPIASLKDMAFNLLKHDKDLACALVREMIHDRLLMNSAFDASQIPLENDVYYEALYLSSELKTKIRNNILWGSGVPIAGVRCNISSSENHGGQSSELTMVYGDALPRAAMCRPVRIWFDLYHRTAFVQTDCTIQQIENSEKPSDHFFPPVSLQKGEPVNKMINQFRILCTCMSQSLNDRVKKPEIHDLECMKLSEYLVYESGSYQFTNCVTNEVLDLVEDLSNWFWKLELPESLNNRMVVQSKSLDCFLVLIDDFFLTFNGIDSALHVQVPNSECLHFNYREIQNSNSFFTDLIGEKLAIQQVYFLARRLLQFTNAEWNYRCLADTEKQTPGAAILNNVLLALFPAIQIDLEPMSFDCISRCEEVGCFLIEENCLMENKVYNVGVKFFGSTVIFERRSNQLANPRIALSVTLESCISFTDRCCFPIGGDNHQNQQVLSVQPEEQGVHDVLRTGLKATETRTSARNNDARRVSKEGFVEIIPTADLTFLNHDDSKLNMYNLAFIPQNKKLCAALSVKFSIHEMDKLEKAFLELNYGEMLSEALVNYAVNQIQWTKGHKTTIAEAQRVLLQGWNSCNHQSMEPFAMKVNKNPMRYLKPGQKFLALKDGRLIIAKSKKKITHTIGAGFHGFSVQAVFAGKDFMEESEVHSILDAAEKIFGAQFKFEPFEDCPCCSRIPTVHGMKQLLGPLLFVSCMLVGRIDPWGRFDQSVHNASDINKRAQPVNLDIPLPAGLLCSTLAKGKLEDKHWMLVTDSWDKERDYKCPIVLGDYRDDVAFLKEMLNLK